MPNTLENPLQPAQDDQSFDDLAEKLFTPPRRDWSYYLVLALVVLPLWSVVPLSWAFVLYALRTGAIWSFGVKGWALFAGALVEAGQPHRTTIIRRLTRMFPGLL